MTVTDLHLRQFGDQAVGQRQPVEISLRIAAQIAKRQDGNRLSRTACRREIRARRFRVAALRLLWLRFDRHRARTSD